MCGLDGHQIEVSGTRSNNVTRAQYQNLFGLTGNFWSFFVQDNVHLTRNLTVNLGVRYEYVQAPYEKEQRIDYVFGADRNNLEPRLGFAYTPDAEEGWRRWLTGGPSRSSIGGIIMSIVPSA